MTLHTEDSERCPSIFQVTNNFLAFMATKAWLAISFIASDYSYRLNDVLTNTAVVYTTVMTVERAIRE